MLADDDFIVALATQEATLRDTVPEVTFKDFCKVVEQASRDASCGLHVPARPPRPQVWHSKSSAAVLNK